MSRLAFGLGVALVVSALVAGVLGLVGTAGLSRDSVRTFLLCCLVLALVAFLGAHLTRRGGSFLDW